MMPKVKTKTGAPPKIAAASLGEGEDQDSAEGNSQSHTEEKQPEGNSPKEN